MHLKNTTCCPSEDRGRWGPLRKQHPGQSRQAPGTCRWSARMPTQRAVPLCKYKRIMPQEDRGAGLVSCRAEEERGFECTEQPSGLQLLHRGTECDSHSPALPSPGPRGVKGHRQQGGCWSCLWTPSLISALNSNAKEVAALTGSLGGMWNTSCSVTGSQSLCHHWACGRGA